MAFGRSRLGGPVATVAAAAFNTLSAAALIMGLAACGMRRSPEVPSSGPSTVQSAPVSDASATSRQGAPPPGLAASRTPQFVCVASDDNGFSGVPGSGVDGGLHYIMALFASLRNPRGTGDARTYDGASPHFTFFVITRFISPDRPHSQADSPYGRDDPVYVKRAWREAVERGHEIAVHTHSHPHGREFTVAQWEAEMRRSIEILTFPWNPSEAPGHADPGSGIGIARRDILGFRAPFIEPSDNGMTAAAGMGFVYDSSLEDGPGLGPHRGYFTWLYRLDDGVPANNPPIGKHPGLWEIPLGDDIVPPDADCPRYGVPDALRARLKKVQAYFQPENGEITGMDWNLWNEFSMTPREFTATLEYTLDRHLAADRCPMTVGLHSELYTVRGGRPEDAVAIRARRAALEEFLSYALRKPEVRLVNHRELLGWLRDPVPLKQAMPRPR